jgi:hypothetical protein
MFQNNVTPFDFCFSASYVVYYSARDAGGTQTGKVMKKGWDGGGNNLFCYKVPGLRLLVPFIRMVWRRRRYNGKK